MNLRFANLTIILIVILSYYVLFNRNTFSQENFVKSIPVKRTLNLHLIDISKQGNKLQIFKSIGIKIGFTGNEYGWHHPFPLITQNYKDPRISSASLGAYIEGLSTLYYSTILEAAYHHRSMKFDYNLYDGNGNVIGTKISENSFTITSFSIAEKIKYSAMARDHELEFYVFGGLKYDLLSSPKFEQILQPYLSSYKSNIYGFTSGIGFSYGKKVRASVDLYYSQDFTDTYETGNGNYKNTEIGIVVGLGYLNLK